MFKSAKVAGSGSPSDRSARVMATKIAEAAAKGGPIVLVAGWAEVFKEVQKGEILPKGIDAIFRGERLEGSFAFSILAGQIRRNGLEGIKGIAVTLYSGITELR
jgi:hypothetical protein